MATDEGPFYLEKSSIPEDSDDEFTYEEIPVDDEFSASEDAEEDLENAVKVVNDNDRDALLTADAEEATVKDNRRPEVVEDFVRNFLVKMGMMKTLDCFQTEWYEFLQNGLLHKEDAEVVPDVYVKNQQLDNLVKSLRAEVEDYRDAAEKAKETHVKLRKERDYHRMHYRRVVQEKNKLINDIKKLKQHYSSYEPTLKTLKQKYEVAMKEKMLTKLERDRAIGQIQGLQSTLSQMEESKANVNVSQFQQNSPQKTVKQLKKVQTGNTHPLAPKSHPNDSMFPPDTGVNPQLSRHKAPCAILTRTGGFKLTKTIHAHDLAISNLSLHPRKQILASASDDKTWKVWAIPDGEIVMSGSGHTDWISDCDFHPNGSKIATASGDNTVKIWDFAKAECVATFADHTHAVWGCSWHTSGDFLATCSMDCTSKIWDINSLRCRGTLRGHSDSVNSIMFLPYSNTLCTCSADKTLSMWDARTGLCAQTFYGHVHSINHVIFNAKGDTLASCDSYGIVNLWDVRNSSIMTTIDLGPYPTNHVEFDPSCTALAISSNDGMIKIYEVANGNMMELTGHEDAVQSALFDRTGDFLISGGSDGTIRIWA